MTIYERKAIELRYRGYTYPQIHKAVGGKISVSGLKKKFATDGNLFIPFMEYIAKQEDYIEDKVRAEFKDQAKYASRIQRSLLQKALKKGDIALANTIVKDMLDRAGVVVVRKAQVNVEDSRERPMTNDEYLEQLRGLGIDPRTGFRLAGQKTQES